MQPEYYHSPYENLNQPDPVPTEKPRRKRIWLALALFVGLIVFFAGSVVTVQLLSPDDESSLLMQIIEKFEGTVDDFFEMPDDFYADYDYNINEETTVITIPRADTNPNVTLTLHNAPKLSLTYQAIYRKVIPSIVSIQAFGPSGAYQGTGVIMTSDGYVITNHHVIAGCSSVDVVLADGTSYAALFGGSDVESDLAVLKIDATGLTPAEFGNSDQLQVGDVALAIGNPLGSELFGTMTEGIVSAINRSVNVDGYTMTLIQTTAALNPGNSGGALLNDAGQVVGITNMKMMSDYDTIEGLGFAIPSVWTKNVVDTLISQGVITGRPTIGITCLTLPEEYWEIYQCPNGGVLVDSVVANSPAAQAGLQPEDVIVACNGQTIVTLEDLTVARDSIGVYGDMDLTVIRDGAELELTLTLIEQHEMYES